MASFKLNLALVRDCPPLLTLKAALETLGRPADKDYGVLVVHDVVEHHLNFGLFRTKLLKGQLVDKTTGEVLRPEVTKDELFDATVRLHPNPDGVGVLETYSGSAASSEAVAEFLAMLELAHNNPSVEAIPQDILATLTALRDDPHTKTFSLQSAKIKNYQDAADETLVGVYNVTFGKEVPPPNAQAFLADHREEVESVKLKYKRSDMKKPMTVTLRQTGFFTFTCDEGDQERAKDVCRALAGVPRPGRAGGVQAPTKREVTEEALAA